MPNSSPGPAHHVTSPTLSHDPPSTPQGQYLWSNVWRYRPANSVASHTPTSPSQPVLLRVHSADAAEHQRPFRRISKMPKKGELPPISEFSIDGIIESLQPEIDETIDAIAEILGRSRLALADHHEVHLPPQGEIRESTHPVLFPVEEATSSNENLAGDDVLILHDDASVADGSTTSSAKRALLQNLKAHPRPSRQQSDVLTLRSAGPARPPTVRTTSLPALLPDPVAISPAVPPKAVTDQEGVGANARILLDHMSKNPPTVGGLQQTLRATTSGTYLTASTTAQPVLSSQGPGEAAGRSLRPGDGGANSVRSRAQSSPSATSNTIQQRFRNWLILGDLRTLASWLRRTPRPVPNDAQARLRAILQRNPVVHEVEVEVPDDNNMYD